MSRKSDRRHTAIPARAAEPDPIESTLRRAVRLRRRGERRKALVLFREASALDEHRARTWTLLGAHCAELGLVDEAVRALRQARWLRDRAGEHARARITAQLIERVVSRAA